ncbi:MAG TPA: transposase [Thermoanaerobaculales bacterium]|nr:transposase [Thermoanaerobaculales bacterium]
MDRDDGSALGPVFCEPQNPRSLPFSPGRSRGRLPHLIKPGCTYFVTFCLQQSRCAHARNRRRPEPAAEPEEVAQLSEPPPASAAPLLGLPRIARVVEFALLHFQGRRYGLHAWCVMPDHVHVLLTPFEDRPLETILHSWKSFTASEANKMLHRVGVFWQRESFDHLVRSPEAFQRFLDYIEANPVAAGLCSVASEWPFSSARHRSALGIVG